MTFSFQKLRYERMSRKISQERMAKMLGMNHTSYWKRENGKVQISVEEFIKILEVMGIPQSEAGNFFTNSVPEWQQIAD